MDSLQECFKAQMHPPETACEIHVRAKNASVNESCFVPNTLSSVCLPVSKNITEKWTIHARTVLYYAYSSSCVL